MGTRDLFVLRICFPLISKASISACRTLYPRGPLCSKAGQEDRTSGSFLRLGKEQVLRGSHEVVGERGGGERFQALGAAPAGRRRPLGWQWGGGQWLLGSDV